MTKLKMFSTYKKASTYEVEKWLNDQLQLTTYQKEILRDREIVRFSSFYFYKTVKKPVNLWWRFTILAWPVYWITAIVTVCIKWVFTGTFGVGKWWLDNIHRPWAERLNL